MQIYWDVNRAYWKYAYDDGRISTGNATPDTGTTGTSRYSLAGAWQQRSKITNLSTAS